MATTSDQKRDRSKLDTGQQARNRYLPCENADGIIQLNNLVPSRYSRIALTYDLCCNICTVTYFCDNIQEQTQVDFVADSCSSLCSTYFRLYAARDTTAYHVWYNVACGGIDPAPACSTAIEVAICACDAAAVIALATKQAICCVVDFDAEVVSYASNRVLITNSVGGTATDTTDVDTGFTFTKLSDGANRKVATLVLTYDANNNITSAYRRQEV